MAAKHSRGNRAKNTRVKSAEDYLLDDYIEAYHSRNNGKEQHNSEDSNSNTQNTDEIKADTESKKANLKSEKADTESKKANVKSEKADTQSKQVNVKAEKVDTDSKKVDVKPERADTDSKKADVKAEKTDIKPDNGNQKSEQSAREAINKKPSEKKQTKNKKNNNSGKKADESVKSDNKAKTDKPESSENDKVTKQDTDNVAEVENKKNNAEESVNIEESDNDKAQPSSHKGAKVLAGILVGAVLIGGVYAAIGYTYYADKFRAGTTLNGIECSGKNADELVNEVKSSVIDNYTLNIYNNDTLIDSISGADIDLKLADNANGYIGNIVQGQNKLYWAKKYLLGKESEIVTDIPVDYDKDKLDALISASDVNNLKKTIENVSPSVSYDGDRFVIEQAVQGDELDKEAFADRVREYISEGVQQMVIQDADVYVKPAAVDIPDLQRQCDAANKYAGIKLSVKLEDTDIDIGNEIVTKAVVVDENSNVTCDENTIKAAVDSVTAKYSTAGIERQFLTSHGGYATVKGGDYGCAVVMTGVLDKAKAAILNGEEVSMSVPYAQDVYNGIGNGAEIGNTYVEVDLTNQYCYVYIDGVLKYQAPVVTGLTGARATPQGVYMLKNKMTNVPLVGDNYVTPVKYWMPFNGGIGLHDAVWQSAFGGERYKTKGSHGCVNLSMTAATNIYNLVEKGMPVVCYYYDRISAFTEIKSPDKVMSTYRALTANERAMLKQIKSGKKVTGAVYASNVGRNAKAYGNTNANAQTAIANRATESIVASDKVTTPAAGSAN